MRITIDIPDDVLSGTRARTPSMTWDLGAVAGPGEALSGGEAFFEGGGVAVSPEEASSAGMAEQGGELMATVPGEGINDGGAAPS